MSKEKWIERRALWLQAHGPDEFPFGYYLHCATVEWEEAHPDEGS